MQVFDQLNPDEERRLYNGISPKFRNARLFNFDADAIAPVIAWAESPCGFLFVHGFCGCGKSHLAAAVKRDFNERRVWSGLACCQDIIAELRASFDNGGSEYWIIRRYAPNLNPARSNGRPGIFDDFGGTRQTDFSIDAWFNIVDRRYRFDYPTMITSNLSLEEIAGSMNDRIASRLASGVIFELRGRDRRVVKPETARIIPMRGREAANG
jgi:DNA replication protein DnaC